LFFCFFLLVVDRVFVAVVGVGGWWGGGVGLK